MAKTNVSKRNFYKLPRQVFHPIVAVDLDGCDNAFQYLVALETGENYPRSKTEGGCRYGRGYNDKKYEYRVVFEHEGRVAAALHKSEKTRRLIAGSYDRDRQYVDKRVCLESGGGRYVIHRNEGLFEHKHGCSGNKSKT